MKKSVLIAFLLLLNQLVFCQDIRIYHGKNSRSAFLSEDDDSENFKREIIKIIRSTEGIVSIVVVNPNPFFYNYEIKTEDVDILEEYTDQFSELAKLITSLPDFNSTLPNPSATRRLQDPKKGFEIYRESLVNLSNEIKNANALIEKSDQPESLDEALGRRSNSYGFGFRAVVDTIENISPDKGHFNSKTLAEDLSKMLKVAIDDKSFDTVLNIIGNPILQELFRDAFEHTNTNLVTTVNKIIQITKKDDVIYFQVPVKANKKSTVKLVITQIDKEGKRELLNTEIAIILPLYVRKIFEVVPAMNLVFQSDRQKFSIEDNLVVSVPDDEAKFNIGAMALMNVASFGEFKEYGVGFGIGYSIEPGGKASSFFGIPSLSYKDIFRVGFGFGYNMAPVGLMNGAKVGFPLPSDITNIEDVVDYKRKLASVFTITIAGIKF